MNIIFLDIDGVLNCQKYLMNNHDKVIEFYKRHGNNINSIDLLVERQMYDIDLEKVKILKDIIDSTNAKVVITSSWKKLEIFPYVICELKNMGIPVIGNTSDNGSNRGFGIKKYIDQNNIDNYVILDDEVFNDYDLELLSRLVKTSFYDNGLKIEHKEIIVKRLNVKK